MDISWALNQDAVFKPILDRDGYNRPIYTPEWDPLAPYPGIPVKVRWQFKQRLVMAANGKEVVSEADVWAPLSISPKPDDTFIYQGKRYTVLNADKKVSIHGEESHWKVYCRTMATQP